jgi:hypothetical protein
MGWHLNLDIKGHRVSDFPHAVYKAAKLGDFDACPAVGNSDCAPEQAVRRFLRGPAHLIFRSPP